MDKYKKPHLTSADRLDGSIVITFDDGRCGVYSSEVLYAALAQARELHEIDAEDLEGKAPAELIEWPIPRNIISVIDTDQNSCA